MVKAAERLRHHLNFYEAQSDSWRRDHDEAMACHDLREVLAAGLFVYERIKRADEELSRPLIDAGQLPRVEDALAVERLYVGWAEKARVDLERADALAAQGIVVDGLDRFRQAYHEVRAVLSIPADRARAALQLAEEGHGRPMGELRDEVRRRLRA